MSIQPAVCVGVDPHADTVTAVGIDEVGAVLWERTVDNSPRAVAGFVDGDGSDGSTRWAIEGSGGLGRLLADRLLERQATVVEVPTRLTARLRLRHGFAKSDPLDATAIARIALYETLPPVHHHRVAEALRVLWGQRESLVMAQTQAANRLRARLRELDPDTAGTVGRIRGRGTFETLSSIDIDNTDPYRRALSVAIRIDAQESLERIDRISQLDAEIKTVMPPAGDALMQIHGIGPTGAAAIITNTGDITRFPTEGHYARHAGTAPLEASSGRHQRHRLNRWGNRQLNRAIHTAIITQLRQRGAAYDYVTRRISEGKTRNEAIRAAKRYLTRRIYKTLQAHPLT